VPAPVYFKITTLIYTFLNCCIVDISPVDQNFQVEFCHSTCFFTLIYFIASGIYDVVLFHVYIAKKLVTISLC